MTNAYPMMRGQAVGAVILQALDWHSTRLGILGGAVETNPIMAALIDHHGLIGHGLVKLAGAVLILALAYASQQYRPKETAYVLGGLNGFMAGVVGTNYGAVWV